MANNPKTISTRHLPFSPPRACLLGVGLAAWGSQGGVDVDYGTTSPDTFPPAAPHCCSPLKSQGGLLSLNKSSRDVT